MNSMDTKNTEKVFKRETAMRGQKRTAIVIGATGLVGKQLIAQLSGIYDCLIIIARTQPKHISSNMQVYQLNNFDNLSEVMSSISSQSIYDAFSCLGTTKKQAGSEDAFKHIDYDYNLDFATLCHTKGVKRFYLLSAMGADASSRFFYNRVKGELENAISQLGFEEVYIFRPSLLLGKHKGRPLETAAQLLYKAVAPMVPSSLSAKPISAIRVAAAMTITAQNSFVRQKFHQSAMQSTKDKLPEKEGKTGTTIANGFTHSFTNSQVNIISNRQMLQMTQRKS